MVRSAPLGIGYWIAISVNKILDMKGLCQTIHDLFCYFYVTVDLLYGNGIKEDFVVDNWSDLHIVW